ncbi:hypothetical protein K469DRAFT_756367 [Zopfia rhizophila CBS 207.26]|uniref:Uncharacterized protein n=1 Tax=Zopfia rhizophila CBS 207.26 TaxID=1314779 RepID=A0A6A6D830_9PEZI|nr:hypothetical protein K469DRAFT_756367 [Zopfia rhizophila CBS 207.26]
MAAENEGNGAKQHDDLDAAGMRALSLENSEGVCHKRPLEQDKPLYDDLGMISGPSVTRKRKCPSSADMIISSVEVLDLTLELDPEDSRSAKRQRPAKQRAESLVSDPVSTLKLTLLPTSGS